MGKKKHAEEHVNLERYLISYADFITLLFATFVVLYALSQVDISEYQKLEDSIKQAFAAPSLIQGNVGIMDNNGQTILNPGMDPESQTSVPPILENLSQTYEQKSFESIESSLNDLIKAGDLTGVEASIHDRGLVINLQNMNLFFKSGSAQLNPESFKSLERIGKIIQSKFASHLIRVEGHTDNLPMSSSIYPSNWELSSARSSSIVRFLLEKFKFKKDRFASVGYAETRPLASNNTEAGRYKNRRVEIVILRNKFSKSESDVGDFTNSKLAENANQNSESSSTPTQAAPSSADSVSDAAKKLAAESGISSEQVIVLKDSYDDSKAKAKEELKKFESNRTNRDKTISQTVDKSAHHSSVTSVSNSRNKLPATNNEKDVVKNLLNNMGDSKTMMEHKQNRK